MENRNGVTVTSIAMPTPATPNVTAPSPTSAPQSDQPVRPEPTALQRGDGSVPIGPPGSTNKKPKKRNNHRGGKKKRIRRQSFAQLSDDGSRQEGRDNRGLDSGMRSSFYMQGRNASNTSIDSEALLDHR